MKFKPLLMTTTAVLVLTAPFWVTHLLWQLRPSHQLRLLVVDYTVPTGHYSHHQGLFWLLNYYRFATPRGAEGWQLSQDYIGYQQDPTRSHRRLSQADLRSYSWLYLVDTYGVYDTDIDGVDTSVLGYAEHGRAPKMVFGALSVDDASKLTAFVRGGGSLVLEFNSFAKPTPPAVRTSVEQLMGVRWSGWVGRFMADLGDQGDIPYWFPKLYQKQYPGQDEPSGPGMMLVHESGKLVVLQGYPIEHSAPQLSLSPQGRQWISGSFGTPPYFNWFAIVSAGRGTEVLAQIALPEHSDWQQQCRRHNVPTVFPLLTRQRYAKSTRIYVAANIANLDQTPGRYQLAGIHLLQAAVHRRRDVVTNRPAFWQLYVPLMGALLKEAAGKTL